MQPPNPTAQNNGLGGKCFACFFDHCLNDTKAILGENSWFKYSYLFKIYDNIQS